MEEPEDKLSKEELDEKKALYYAKATPRLNDLDLADVDSIFKAVADRFGYENVDELMQEYENLSADKKLDRSYNRAKEATGVAMAEFDRQQGAIDRINQEAEEAAGKPLEAKIEGVEVETPYETDMGRRKKAIDETIRTLLGESYNPDVEKERQLEKETVDNMKNSMRNAQTEEPQPKKLLRHYMGKSKYDEE